MLVVLYLKVSLLEYIMTRHPIIWLHFESHSSYLVLHIYYIAESLFLYLSRPQPTSNSSCPVLSFHQIKSTKPTYSLPACTITAQKMSSIDSVCVANTHLLIHVSRSAIITVWILTALLQIPCFIFIMILLNAPDFIPFCSGQRDDPLAILYVGGSGYDRKITAAPKIDGRLAMMRSKSLLRFGIGLGLWILAAMCFVFEGLAISEAQFCSGDSDWANPRWAFPWAMYGIVQGLIVTVAGFSVWRLWLERQRLEWRGQKGKTREESIDSVERGKATAKKEEDGEMWEMQELYPEEPAQDTERETRLDARRAMRSIAGEGSSRMAESRHASRGLSIASTAAGSMAGRWPSVGEVCLGHEHGKMQAYDRALRTNSQVRPKLQIRRGGRWEDEKDAIELIP